MENQAAIARLLLVSRDAELLRVVWAAIESTPWQLIIASSAWEAMEKLQSDLAVDALLIDWAAENPDGLRCLPWLRRLRSAVPILLIDRTQQASATPHTIRVGANEYLVAPLSAPKIQIAIAHSISLTHDGSEIGSAANGIEQMPGDALLFIGASPKMHRLTAQVALLADKDLPVLISGEPGTGKGMIARLLHQLSARSAASFVRVDCSSLSDELLEREIFGDEAPRGTRTGGNTCGKLTLSAGGTLFLDELDEMPLHLQSKLARMMESGLLQRSATSPTMGIDIRVIAASSLPINRANSERRIVQELSRQFGDREICVPPLRERKEELPLLARYFMHQLCRQFGIVPKEIPVAMEEAWQLYQWPGNLRELKQLVKQHLVAGETTQQGKGTAADRASVAVQIPLANAQAALAHPTVRDIGGYKSLRSMVRSAREEAERSAIASALESTGWNRKAAARMLKVSYRSILYKIEQYHMNAPKHATSSTLELALSEQAETTRYDRKEASALVLASAVCNTSMEPA